MKQLKYISGLVFVSLAMVLASHAQTVTVTVPATSDIWINGVSPNDSLNTDTLLNATPLQVSSLTISNYQNGMITFGATGSWSYNSGEPFCGPEGFPMSFLPDFTGAGTNYGIGLVDDPYFFSLVGVFTDGSAYTNRIAPPISTIFAGSNSVYQPVINQPFYIGDGTNLSGNVTTYIIPPTATALCLGPTDLQMDDDVGSATVTITVTPVPQLTQNLTNLFALSGTNLTIGVTVESQTPVSYQWYFVPANNSGQAGAYAQIISGFVYNVVVTNGGFGYGNVPNVSFAGGGGSGAAGYATVSDGSLTEITVTNAGYGYTNGPSVLIDPPNGWLPGQTNSTFTITNTSPNSLGNYYVVVTSATGSVTSSVVNLTLLYPPSIATQPQDQVVNGNGTASFNVGAAGTSPFSYQWLFEGTNLLNSNAGTLTVSSVTPQNLGPYAVIVTNNYGSVTSSIANLYMYPYLAMPFSGVTTDWGQTNVLSVGAWGSGSLAYQWNFNGTAISGATSSNLVLSGIQFTNAGLYSVVVSNSYGSVTNTPEQVVVNPAGVSLGLYAGVIIQGTVGYHYNIQSSTNLSDPNSWNTLTNITLTSPVEFWSDYSIDVHNTPQRFYQIVPGQ